MNRTVLALAAAALAAAGCTSRQCDVPSVNVYWSFTDPNGVVRRCADAGVATVRVFVDGQVADPTNPDLACVPFGNGVEGVTLLDFRSGSTHDLQVEGYDRNGQLLYLDQRSFTVRNDCGGNDVYVNLAAQASDMTVAYAVRGASGCTTPSAASAFPTTFIWYELLDQSGQVYSTANFSSSRAAIPCSTGGAIAFTSALYGQYTVSRIEEVELQADGSYVVYAYNCQPQTFQHLQPNDSFTATMVRQAAGGTSTCF